MILLAWVHYGLETTVVTCFYWITLFLIVFKYIQQVLQPSTSKHFVHAFIYLVCMRWLGTWAYPIQLVKPYTESGTQKLDIVRYFSMLNPSEFPEHQLVITALQVLLTKHLFLWDLIHLISHCPAQHHQLIPFAIWSHIVLRNSIHLWFYVNSDVTGPFSSQIHNNSIPCFHQVDYYHAWFCVHYLKIKDLANYQQDVQHWKRIWVYLIWKHIKNTLYDSDDASCY